MLRNAFIALCAVVAAAGLYGASKLGATDHVGRHACHPYTDAVQLMWHAYHLDPAAPALVHWDDIPDINAPRWWEKYPSDSVRQRAASNEIYGMGRHIGALAEFHKIGDVGLVPRLSDPASGGYHSGWPGNRAWDTFIVRPDGFAPEIRRPVGRELPIKRDDVIIAPVEWAGRIDARIPCYRYVAPTPTATATPTTTPTTTPTATATVQPDNGE